MSIVRGFLGVEMVELRRRGNRFLKKVSSRSELSPKRIGAKPRRSRFPLREGTSPPLHRRREMDWGFVHKAWDKWASLNIASPGESWVTKSSSSQHCFSYWLPESLYIGFRSWHWALNLNGCRWAIKSSFTHQLRPNWTISLVVYHVCSFQFH